VVRTRVGYAGGTTPNPTYRRIGDHMETLQIEYDPDRITYQALLEIFFSSHNPAQRSFTRQYASAIFYHDDEQRRLALNAIDKAGETYGRRITTELVPYSGFTRAEDYHQKYYLRNQESLEKRYEAIYPDPARFTDSTATARVNGYLGGNGSREQFEREAPGLGLTDAQIGALRVLVRKGGR
jgi:peptide-methionine (S)-S-oxide reductase